MLNLKNLLAVLVFLAFFCSTQGALAVTASAIQRSIDADKALLNAAKIELGNEERKLSVLMAEARQYQADCDRDFQICYDRQVQSCKSAPSKDRNSCVNTKVKNSCSRKCPRLDSNEYASMRQKEIVSQKSNVVRQLNESIASKQGNLNNLSKRGKGAARFSNSTPLKPDATPTRPRAVEQPTAEGTAARPASATSSTNAPATGAKNK